MEEVLQKDYKLAYGDYVVTKILRDANRFEDMKYQYMFEYFKKDFSAYKEGILKRINAKPYTNREPARGVSYGVVSANAPPEGTE